MLNERKRLWYALSLQTGLCRQVVYQIIFLPTTAFHLAPVLYHWAPDLPMTVETDASDYAIVGILSITTSDLEICPIAFHS